MKIGNFESGPAKVVNHWLTFVPGAIILYNERLKTNL